MGSLNPSPFSCDIYCEIEDELKKILNEMKRFEGYKFREGKKEEGENEWIGATFTGSHEEDATWKELNHGKMVPPQCMDLHKFLVKHQFVMSIGATGSLTYKRSAERFSDSSCMILCGTKDKRTELVKYLERSEKPYIITILTGKRVQVDFINMEGPETEPPLYTFLCDVLRMHGFKPRFSHDYPREFTYIQSESSWTEKRIRVTIS